MYDRIRGVLDQPVGEGTHFRVPWLQTPNIMDIRTRPRTISSVTGTKGDTLQYSSVGCMYSFMPFWLASTLSLSGGGYGKVVFRHRASYECCQATLMRLCCM